MNEQNERNIENQLAALRKAANTSKLLSKTVRNKNIVMVKKSDLITRRGSANEKR